MTEKEKWVNLLRWLTVNNWVESRFLTPVPQANVNLVELLDKIAELRGISKEENGIEFNNIIDDLR